MKRFASILILSAVALCFCFGAVACALHEAPSGTNIPAQSEQGGRDDEQQGDPEQPEKPDDSNKPETPGEQEQPNDSDDPDEEITTMFITINGTKKEVTLAQNSSVTALTELLKAGEITYTASDYGGFEKVGGLGHTLPANHTQTVTEPGDIVLYQSDQIVMFYGSNSWSYTRLGKIKYSDLDELKDFLAAGRGSVSITLSLD